MFPISFWSQFKKLVTTYPGWGPGTWRTAFSSMSLLGPFQVPPQTEVKPFSVLVPRLWTSLFGEAHLAPFSFGLMASLIKSALLPTPWCVDLLLKRGETVSLFYLRFLILIQDFIWVLEMGWACDINVSINSADWGWVGGCWLVHGRGKIQTRKLESPDLQQLMLHLL